MSIETIFWLIAMIPLFASRVFLPTFLTALFFRFPQYFPFVDINSQAPIADWLLVVLGILTVLEIWADKNTDIKEIFHTTEKLGKPVAFAAVHLGLIDESSKVVIEQIQWAGFIPEHIIIVLGSLGVYWLNGLRSQFYEFLYQIDDQDTLGLRKMFSWLEDSLVVFAFFMMIILGIFAFIFYGIFWIILYIFQKKIEKNQEKHKKPCTNCQELVLPFAVACRNCHSPQGQVHDINFLGIRKEKYIQNTEKHQIRLLTHKRCPECANKLTQRNYKQVCTNCGITTSVLVSPEKYLRELDKRFIGTILLSIILGFIPILGIVCATIFSNFYLISPLKRYTPVSQTWFSKFLVRLLILIILLTGTVLGFLAAPLYCLLRYLSLRIFFKK